jgi:hypothetical protein
MTSLAEAKVDKTSRKGNIMKLVLLASLLVSTSVFANDVDPNGFEKEHFNGTMTRAEAIAQAKTARGPSIRIDDQGRAITAPSTKSRAQVAAEAREAARLGLMKYGEVGPVQTTAEQEQQIALAGLRATGHSASE